MAYSVADFVSEVDAAINEQGVSREMIMSLGPKLQQLVAEGGDLTVQGEASAGSSGLGGRILHVDPDKRFRLVVARFASDEPTPVHAHHRWGLECGISGKERFTVWSRVDDGSEADKAELRVLTDHHIERGDLGHWFDAPSNIHRQWAEGGEPSCVVILMGGDGARESEIDLESGAVTSV